MSTGQTGTAFAAHIIDTSARDELSESFLAYAISVIKSRAVPDVRDGLKPVHRRLLYAMWRAKLAPTSPYRKSARVVGDTMGAFHPHGDSAIYEALVRLAQPWNLPVPLVDGHGNFGSVSDGPAASRYTEARLSAAGMALLESLDEGTVDFVPNYDNSETEPVTLPTAFPNLLVNGSQGIAVGMSTSIPPHNLVEVVDACKGLLANPKMTADEFLTFVPGPDFPTGGEIVDPDAVRAAYLTGKGSFRLRARASIEHVTARRQGIVVTELPYAVSPERVIARIQDLVSSKKLDGIADIGDFTDRSSGLRIVIEIRPGFSPEAVLAELFRLTPLETTFSVSAVVLDGLNPVTLPFVDLARRYLDYRRVVVRRRSEHRKAKAERRLHLVEGLIVALDVIDEVVATIRRSRSTKSAADNLRKQFGFTLLQAEHILDMQLRRLTSLEVTKLRAEQKELSATIRQLDVLLRSKKKLDEAIAGELDQVSVLLGSPRKTGIGVSFVPQVSSAAGLETPDMPCVVGLTVDGALGRVASNTGRGKPTRHDMFTVHVPATTRSDVLAVTSAGVVHRLPVTELPEIPVHKPGVPASRLIGFDSPDEKIVALLPAVLPADAVVAFGTRNGVVKQVPAGELAGRAPFPVLTLNSDDRLVGAGVLAGDGWLTFVTGSGQLLRFPSSTVRPQQRPAAGMAGIRLSAEDQVVGFAATAGDTDDVWVVTDSGAVKRTRLVDYPPKGRATSGVRCVRLRSGEKQVSAAVIGEGLYPVTKTGVPTVLPDFGRRDGSAALLDAPVVGAAYPRP